MNWKTSSNLRYAGNTNNRRRSLATVSGLTALMVLFAAQPSEAQVHFRYVGGRWSHTRHTGWNRYWGGPDVGFYYAPTPVYVVPGYAAPSYYSGSDFWTSNPSFGISLNFGGGGYYGGGGGYYPRRYYAPSDHHYGRPQGNYHNYGGNSYGHTYGGNAHSHTYGGSSYGHSYGGRSSERGRR